MGEVVLLSFTLIDEINVCLVLPVLDIGGGITMGEVATSDSSSKSIYLSYAQSIDLDKTEQTL